MNNIVFICNTEIIIHQFLKKVLVQSEKTVKHFRHPILEAVFTSREKKKLIKAEIMFPWGGKKFS